MYPHGDIEDARSNRKRNGAMTERRDASPQRAASAPGLSPADREGSGLVPTEATVPANPTPAQPAVLGQVQPPAPPPVGPMVAAGQATNVNVTTNVGGPTMIFTHQKTGPGFFIRALWYVFIGWWASALAIVVAYLAMATLIGIPLAFAIFNRLPTILTLRPRTTNWAARTEGDVTYVELGTERQRPWWQRAIYFIFIGFWFGAIWLTAAWLIGLLVITLPLSFWMYNRVSGVMTLHRH